MVGKTSMALNPSNSSILEQLTLKGLNIVCHRLSYVHCACMTVFVFHSFMLAVLNLFLYLQ